MHLPKYTKKTEILHFSHIFLKQSFTYTFSHLGNKEILYSLTKLILETHKKSLSRCTADLYCIFFLNDDNKMKILISDCKMAE